MDTYHNFSNEDVAVVPDLCSICGSGPGQDVQYGSRERAWSASIAELQTATDNGCRLCALLLDAAITSSEKDLDLNVDDGFSFLTFEVDWPMANGGSRKALYMLIEHDAFKDSMAFDSFEVFQASFNHTGHAQDVWSEPASSLRDYPILPEDPASIMMATQVSAWMEECNGSHSKCGKAHQVRLPRRILELQDTMVVLRDNQHGKLRGTYACLSHCWGSKGPSTKLTMSTEKKLSEGLALTALPKTFEEVARVCMSLGIQYLWIDALCM